MPVIKYSQISPLIILTKAHPPKRRQNMRNINQDIIPRRITGEIIPIDPRP
jgi:hypothetical protein